VYDSLLNNTKVLTIDVGGGNTPRTAQFLRDTFVNEKSVIISVDPEIKKEYVDNTLHGVICFDKMIEDVDLNPYLDNAEFVLIVAVHCHANMHKLWNRLLLHCNMKPLVMVTMPCCKKFVNFPKEIEPKYKVKETGISSASDEIMIFAKNLESFK
jgi:hypothetical protein